jgi:hypothetical protein
MKENAPRDFTVSEGHGHPLVFYNESKQSGGGVPLLFSYFKTLIRETEMNRTNKISSIKTFVLFFRKFVNIEFDF